VRAVEADLPVTVKLAGASYHGIGIPACIRSGRAAAEAITFDDARASE
jgi:oxygen-dependent protoporphyrinogen oxidase